MDENGRLEHDELLDMLCSHMGQMHNIHDILQAKDKDGKLLHFNNPAFDKLGEIWQQQVDIVSELGKELSNVMAENERETKKEKG